MGIDKVKGGSGYEAITSCRLRLKCDGTHTRRNQISSFGEKDESI